MTDEGTSPAGRSEGLSERVRRRLEQQRARVAHRGEQLDLVIEPLAPEARRVPWGVDLAAAWAWRFLVICAAGYLILRVIGFFQVIVLPVIVAILISALMTPLVRLLMRVMPRGVAAIVVVVVGVGAVALLLTFVGQQVANGAQDLADSTVQGLDKIKEWLKTGPLHASESQIQDYIDQLQRSVENASKSTGVIGRVGEVGTAVGHVLAGFFIVLFSTYFFLADGDRIWAWFVRLAPRAARGHVDSSGQVAWHSLTQFVRATVLVAAVDAAGVMVVAAVLRVPFVLAIGVLVFLGAFVPMIGATIAGTVAVLVALVDHGPITALVMLGGVIVVQQIEGHVLQPFLMGRFVSVHPLAVIVAIGCGVLVAGVSGALVAVPLAAVVNAVGQHLASYTAVGESEPEEIVDEEIAEEDPDAPPVPAAEGGALGD